MIKHRKVRLSPEEKIIAKRLELAKTEKVAAIWTRVSSADQFKHNSSIPTQVAACEEYCRRNNIRIKKYFGGVNESGAKAGELFLDMIGEVLADPEYNHIIVYDFDRFSRSSEDGIIYKAKAKQSGVVVKSVNQPIDEKNVLAEQIENIFIIIANIDNAMRRHKCHDGMVACINRGEWYSKPPVGYDTKKVGKSHVVTVNDKGRILRKAFEWLLKEPSITQTEILHRLTALGLDISKQTLSQCLRNCFYCGLIEHKFLDGGRIEGKQEALITKPMFWAVQDILDGNHQSYVHSEITPRFPLKGYLRCAADKHVMSGYTVKAKDKDYYKCNVKGCHTNISAQEVHSKFAGILNSLSIPDVVRPILEIIIRKKFEEKEGDLMVRRALVEKNLATLRTKLQTAKMKYLTEGEISGEDYHDVKAELESRIAQCEQELKTCSISCSNFSEYASTTLQIASSLGSEWEKMNFKVCQEIQDLVFPEGVLWDKENRVPRTENMNPFFAQIGLVARSARGMDIKNKDSAEALSCLVAGGGLEPPTSGL